MKKILFGIIIIFTLTGLIYVGLLYSSEQLDKLALTETKKIIGEIERFQTSNGNFPADIGQFLDSHSFRRKIRFGFLSTDIKIYKHQDAHFIKYHQAPFGPFYGYNFKSKEWYSTE